MEEYDRVIIDSPARISRVNADAVRAADLGADTGQALTL